MSSLDFDLLHELFYPLNVDLFSNIVRSMRKKEVCHIFTSGNTRGNDNQRLNH